MSVIPITLFFSLLLAATFVLLFARDHRRRRFASAERDSLLPLADETPRPVAAPVATDPHDEARGHAHDHHDDHDHDHDHAHDHDHHHAHDAAHGACGCRSGLRPPCPGCLRRRPEPLAGQA